MFYRQGTHSIQGHHCISLHTGATLHLRTSLDLPTHRDHTPSKDITGSSNSHPLVKIIIKQRRYTMATLEDKDGVRYTVRQVSTEDLEQMQELTQAEGWSLTLEDVRAMYSPQPQAFMGVYTKEGVLISE